MAYNNQKKAKDRGAVYKGLHRAFRRATQSLQYEGRLAADAKRDPPPDASIYGTLNDAIVVLVQRLDKHIAELFEGEAVAEDDLIADRRWSEMNPVITDLIALLR